MPETTTQPGIWTLRDRQYLLIHEPTGTPVSEGDTVTDFRGKTITITYLSRGPEYNGTAKVCVEEAGGREYYSTVFGLKAYPMIEVGVPYKVRLWDPREFVQQIRAVMIENIDADRTVTARMVDSTGQPVGDAFTFAWGDLREATPLH